MSVTNINWLPANEEGSHAFILFNYDLFATPAIVKSPISLTLMKATTHLVVD